MSKTDIHQYLKAQGVEEEVAKKMVGDLGVEAEDDLMHVSVDDLVGLGMKPVQARKLVTQLRPATPAAEQQTPVLSVDAALPTVPSEEAWLKALRAGGVLKVEESTVIATIRAALAHRAGLFSVPEKLAREMERFADSSEEPVPTEFYGIRKMLTRRNYGDIFEAIDGLDGSFVTEARKATLLQRLDNRLWPALVNMQKALATWHQTWMQEGTGPAMMMAALMSVAGRGGAGMMPPGVMSPPSTEVLREAAEEFFNACNQVFKGTGVQIAVALAYEAKRIIEILAKGNLHGMIGAANYEQMLKQLGVTVPATYPRLETNVTRFAFSTFKVKDLSGGDEELRYFTALHLLGTQIDWNSLASPKGLGIGQRS